MLWTGGMKRSLLNLVGSFITALHPQPILPVTLLHLRKYWKCRVVTSWGLLIKLLKPGVFSNLMTVLKWNCDCITQPLFKTLMSTYCWYQSEHYGRNNCSFELVFLKGSTKYVLFFVNNELKETQISLFDLQKYQSKPWEKR